MAVAASSAARMSTAVRQPTAVVSQPVRGKKMLLANPATIVTVSRAEERRAGSVLAITTLKAAS